jgi:phage protein D
MRTVDWGTKIMRGGLLHDDGRFVALALIAFVIRNGIEYSGTIKPRAVSCYPNMAHKKHRDWHKTATGSLAKQVARANLLLEFYFCF